MQRCSRAGCEQLAVWRIGWRNPRIHDATRTKVWLACAPHLDDLVGFLRARSFPVTVEPIATRTDADDVPVVVRPIDARD